MSTFYVGARPILRGRNENEFKDTFLNGTVGSTALNKKANRHQPLTQAQKGVYSFYPLFGPGLLTGAPDRNHVPGTGIFPHGLYLSYIFTGKGATLYLQTRKNSLVNSGQGTRLAGHRFRPLTFRGLKTIWAVKGVPQDVEGASDTYGHAFRDAARIKFTWAAFPNNIYSGIGTKKSRPLQDTGLGHAVRAIGATGAPATFGEFQPLKYKGVSPVLKSGFHSSRTEQSATLGQALPAGHDTDPYGHNKVNEWFGVPSGKAL